MPDVRLISFPGCPNAAVARAQLLRAFVAVGLAPRWTEHEAGDPELPPEARGFGSPTILVDGRDVGGARPGGSPEACRLYRGGTGAPAGVPPLPVIVAALGPGRRGSWSSLGALPALASGAT